MKPDQDTHKEAYIDVNLFKIHGDNVYKKGIPVGEEWIDDSITIKFNKFLFKCKVRKWQEVC